MKKASHRTPGPEGRVDKQTHCVSSHNQKKDNKFKNKKQPNLPENKTVWKSDNQEVKEETFNQTSRRSGVRQLGLRGLAVRWRLEDQGGKGGGSHTK